MPDFAPNVTPRYRLHYTAGTRPHTIQARCPRDTNFSGVELFGRNLFNALFTALVSILFDDLNFTSAEVALTDSDLFFPAAVPTHVTGTIAIALASKQDSITHLTFTGRGTLGSKTSLHVYGPSINPDALPATVVSDFVLTGTELAAIGTAVTGLNSVGNGLVTVDNTKPLFPNRCTIKLNDFWLRRVRAGG